MPRPQFTLKTLLWLMAVVAAFFGGAEWGHQSGRERQRKEDEAAAALATKELKRQADMYVKYSTLIDSREWWKRQEERERRKAERLANERVDVGTPPWVEDRRREAAARSATTRKSGAQE